MVKIDMPNLLKALDEQDPGKRHFIDRQTGKILSVTVSDMPSLEKMQKMLKAEPQRYSAVPRQEARDNFAELEEFVEPIKDMALKNQLKKALSSHAPFREFRDVIDRRFTDKRNWEAFHTKKLEERAARFIKTIGLK